MYPLSNTSAIAQTEKVNSLGDTIVIEKVRIKRPQNYKPGDILVPKGYLFLLQDNREQYLQLLRDRELLSYELDSLFYENQRLYSKLDSAENFIWELRGKSDVLARKILKADLENIRAEESLKRDWNKFKRIEDEKQSRLLYQFHLLKKWDRVAIASFGIGITGLVVYLLTETVIGLINSSANNHINPNPGGQIPIIYTRGPSLKFRL